MAGRHTHEVMVGRVKIYLVYAVSETVMAPKHRPVFVGLETQRYGVRGACQGAEGFQVGLGPASTFPADSLDKGHILIKKIVIL
jgi:hypothetical protein